MGLTEESLVPAVTRHPWLAAAQMRRSRGFRKAAITTCASRWWHVRSIITWEACNGSFPGWGEELQRFRGALFVCFSIHLLATFRDTLNTLNQLQNDSRNRLQNGPEMSPKPVLQEGAKGSPKVTSRQGWSRGTRERPSINFNEV